MSVWDWVHEHQRDALAAGNWEALELSECLQDLFSFMETDPDQALDLAAEGKRMAEALGEPWWVLLFEHWRLQVLLHYKHDYRDLVDAALNATVQACKPQYQAFPQRICLQEDLITGYLNIDPLGHAGAIEDALAYMEREVSPELECRHCTRQCRIDYDMTREDLAAAWDHSIQALECAEEAGSNHYKYEVCDRLCQIAYRRGDFEAVQGFAVAGEEAVRQIGKRAPLATFLLWRAVAAVRAGDRAQAGRLHAQAVGLTRSLLRHLGEGYYDALCAYHAEGGDLEKALAVRTEELRELHGTGRLHQECRVRILRCGLLAGLGRLTDADLEDARAAAGKMRQPDAYLARIDALKPGG